MKSKMAGIVAIALALTALSCAQAVGDSGERAMAENVKDAFAKGDVLTVFELLSPESQAKHFRDFDASMQSLTDTDKESRESSIKSINDEMWWDTMWEKIEDIDDLNDFDDDERVMLTLGNWREYASSERVKDFKERIEDLRLTGYSRDHQSGMHDWGSATIEFTNRWNDGLTVSLVQRSGQWYVTDISPRFQLLSKEDTEAARKMSE